MGSDSGMTSPSNGSHAGQLFNSRHPVIKIGDANYNVIQRGFDIQGETGSYAASISERRYMRSVFVFFCSSIAVTAP